MPAPPDPDLLAPALTPQEARPAPPGPSPAPGSADPGGGARTRAAAPGSAELEHEPGAERAEVRDVLAWTRLLADPGDASAVVRALARPPIELRQVDLARVIQIARRRKLDMVAALAVAIESPQLPPEARARIQRFLELHRAASAALAAGRPDLLARAALGAERDGPRVGLACTPAAAAREEADAALADMQRIVREEALVDVARIGARLSELRLDTDLDISHGVARYLELLKLSALAQRPPEQSIGEALADVNARLLAAATALQREILQSSPLDATLLAHDAQAARVQAASPRGEPSLVPFLPRRGGGLALSASDVETYRSCPLRYKFARVLRIPTEPTVGQRFGIVVHQTLERYHAAGGETLTQLLDLFESCWRRGGFRGERESERELRVKARAGLERYHLRLHGQESQPVWFERPFSLRIGPHHLRGRVDRVDRLPACAQEDLAGAERYELIDYKTSRPRPAGELREEIQLSLYTLAARESWGVEAASRAYHYILDDQIVRLPAETDEERVRARVLEAGEGIMAQRFEPTPSRAACGLCDFRIVCPAAER